MKYFLLLMCTMSAFVTNVHAGVIFDNSDTPQFTSIRSDQGIAAYLQIGASDVTISQIAIDAAPSAGGQLKFVIFSDGAYPGNNAGSVLLSDTVNVSPSGSLTYLLSDLFAFTLQAGHYYDIGAIFGAGNITYAYDLLGDTEGDIASIARNQNIGQFASPILLGHALGDAEIKLYSASATATPEPLSAGLFGVGLVLYLISRFFAINVRKLFV